MENAKATSRDTFIKSLSNYSECIRPFLRVAQERYVASYYSVESQSFDFNKYCVIERKEVNQAKDALLKM